MPQKGNISIIPAHDISVIRNKLYVFGDNDNGIYDVTNHRSPELLVPVDYNDPNLNIHSGWVTDDDKYLFVCIEEGKEAVDVLIFDISNPAFPIRVAEIHDTNSTAHNLYIIGSYAYVSFYTSGFRVYDISDPIIPTLIYEFDTKGSPEQQGAWSVFPFTSSENI
jgi:hypothetical protein